MSVEPVAAARVWVCVACRARNEMQADVCAACGTSFSALLHGDGSAPSARSWRIPPAAREAAFLAGLFLLWRIAGLVSLGEGGAFDRGRDLWRVERALRLPSEVAWQAPILPHPALVQALNVFYLAAHVGGMAVLLVWLFFWRRAQYRRWRNVVVAFTGASLLLQLIAVAPPRLLPGLGFVDTAAAHHQSAYQGAGPGLVDQLSTIPSIHVGWALIVAAAVISAGRSRWRWLAVAHPVLTVYVVVVTANHFWLDAVAAIVVVGVVIAAQQWQRQRRRSAKRDPGAASAQCDPGAVSAERDPAAPGVTLPDHT